MAQAREHVLPSGARGTYHVLSRCTRREFLLGGGKNECRRAWAVGLLADLLDGFAIDLHAYAIMSNHVHLVLRPRPDLAAAWSTQQICSSWPNPDPGAQRRRSGTVAGDAHAGRAPRRQ